MVATKDQWQKGRLCLPCSLSCCVLSLLDASPHVVHHSGSNYPMPDMRHNHIAGCFWMCSWDSYSAFTV